MAVNQFALPYAAIRLPDMWLNITNQSYSAMYLLVHLIYIL